MDSVSIEAETPSTPAPGALAGVKVLDLSRFVAGPYCAMLLGDLGADVLKVESIGKGENSRAFFPRIGDESIYTMVFNRNKRALTLDFRNPAAQNVLRELIAKADVVVENFVPGTLEKMGCGWDAMHELNPRLIMTRISGFGSSGPYASRPCFDVIAQAMSGLMDLTGMPDGPPTMAGTFVADYTTGLYATIGTLAALNARTTTGVGQLVESTLINSALSLLVTAIPNQMLFGQTTTRNGNRDRFVAPSNTFKTSEGAWILFQAAGEEKFRLFAESIGQPGLPTDPRFASNDLRMKNIDALEAIIQAWASGLTAPEALRTLEGATIPCAKVATVAEVIENPQVQHDGQIIWMDQAGGKVPVQGFTVKLSDTPMALRRPAPSIGEHTAAALNDWIGYSAAEVEELRKQKVV